MMRARVTALVSAVLALAALVAAAHSSRAEAQAAAVRAAGNAQVANSKNGAAILSGPLGPGDSLTGTVTIANVGSAAGPFTLSLSHLVNTGAPAGPLSQKLDLAVDDVTNAASPVAVYRGQLGALPATALGSFDTGASRTYRFTVSWVDGGAADSVYAGSAVSVQFDWSTSDNGGGGGTVTTPVTPPPTVTAPKLRFRAAKKQRMLKRGWLFARARCDQKCKLTVVAKISMRGWRKPLKVRTMRKTLKAGVDTKVKLRFRKSTMRRLRRGVRSHQRPMVRLTVTASGSGGTSRAVKRGVRVTG